MLTEIRRIRRRTPDAVAVRCGTAGGEWVETSWDQLCDDAAAVAARARQVTGADPVIVVVDGTAASVATVIGVVQAGLDVVLMEEKSSYLSDPRSPVDAVGATLVVGPADPDAAAVAAAKGRTYLEYGRFRAPDDGDDGPPPRVSRILQLTSGSTGEPRVARQTMPGVLQGAEAYRDLFEFTESDVILVTVPLAHSYGLAGMFASLISAATLVTIPRFSIRSLLAALDDDVTVLLGTPMVYRLVSPVLNARRRSARVRTALSAGGPMTTEVADAARQALGTPVRQIYGITEAGLVACVPRSVTQWPPGSVGHPAPGVRLRIDSEPGPDDDELPPQPAPDGSRTGRLYVWTLAMFEGYVGSTAPHLTEDGFYDTGDVVRLDADGVLTVLGRKGSFINVGGRKVNPRRVERLLSEHPAVRDAYVFGVERSDGEEEIHAAVVLDPQTYVDQVLAHCRAGTLMPYEIPHHVHVLERMPRTGMGKIDRAEVLAATRQPARAAVVRG
ncbi:AMP-binding protein [Solwaraspora sp. WMMD406]|uniref:class I adenylate-forming enzyme family protein n=1 Tax=Solwaraspora sp. WMMD406 TaxID=3016095 RepID=UPI00241787F8|nr:AMP-binding protein [Solwaraspora sp. WMMD406]MDG4766920.1 AMP-binding protein [Solwaraspora sp. WMMD406]